MRGRVAMVMTLTLMVAGTCGQRVELKEGSACRRVSGVEWTCRKLSHCSSARENIKNGIEPTVCKRSGNDDIVCCEPTEGFEDRISPGAESNVTGINYNVDEGNICKHVAGLEWTCTKLKYCAEAIQKMASTGKVPEMCRPSGSDVVVCCDKRSGLVTEPTLPESTEPDRAQPEPPGQISKRMCKKYAASINRNQCTSFEPLVVNGENAYPKEFPHMALLGYDSSSGTYCGGSLISDRWILSAAHCTSANDDGPSWARLGDYNVQSKEDDERLDARPVVYRIIKRVNHQDYEPRDKKWYNDIALYKLDRVVEFDQYIRPICLHTEYEVPGNSALISGWGKLDQDSSVSKILQKGKVVYVSKTECKRRYRIANRTVNDETTICTNSLSGTTVCGGDSGGPLQYRLDDCMYRQVGVTSLGTSFCEVDRYPAIYTRVSKYISWIESTVWSEKQSNDAAQLQ